MIKLNRKGQNTLEYVLLITAVVAAFLAIQHYLNRGVQGRVRDAADSIGSQFDAQATVSNFSTTRNSSVQETNEDGITRSELLTDEVTERDISEMVAAPGSEVLPVLPISVPEVPAEE